MRLSRRICEIHTVSFDGEGKNLPFYFHRLPFKFVCDWADIFFFLYLTYFRLFETLKMSFLFSTKYVKKNVISYTKCCGTFHSFFRFSFLHGACLYLANEIGAENKRETNTERRREWEIEREKWRMEVDKNRSSKEIV